MPSNHEPSAAELLAALLDAVEVHTVDGHCVGFTGDPRKVYAAWAPARAYVDAQGNPSLSDAEVAQFAELARDDTEAPAAPDDGDQLCIDAGRDPNEKITRFVLADFAGCLFRLIEDETITRDQAVALVREADCSSLGDVLCEASGWGDIFEAAASDMAHDALAAPQQPAGDPDEASCPHCGAGPADAEGELPHFRDCQDA